MDGEEASDSEAMADADVDDAAVLDDCPTPEIGCPDPPSPGEVMMGHTFYAGGMTLLTTAAHLVFIEANRFMGTLSKVPGPFKFPQMEIKIFMALSMGMLDVSTTVLLAGPETGLGWKLLASLEVMFALWFIVWFMKKGIDFQKTVVWRPIANVKKLSNRDIGGDDGGEIRLAEVLKMAPKLGLSKGKATALFQRLDPDGDGLVAYADWRAQFHDYPERVPFEKAGFLEGCYALCITPRMEGGKYYPVDPKNKEYLTNPFSPHFSKFTPFHSHYYFFNIVRQFAEAWTLNGLAEFSLLQGSAMTVIELVSFCLVLQHAPYVMLAQSRADLFTSCVRFMTFSFATLPLIPVLGVPDTVTAQAMIIIQGLSLIHNIIAQMSPLFFQLIGVVVAFFGPILEEALCGDDQPDPLVISPSRYVYGEYMEDIIDRDGDGQIDVMEILDRDGDGVLTEKDMQGLVPIAEDEDNEAAQKHQSAVGKFFAGSKSKKATGGGAPSEAVSDDIVDYSAAYKMFEDQSADARAMLQHQRSLQELGISQGVNLDGGTVTREDSAENWLRNVDDGRLCQHARALQSGAGILTLGDLCDLVETNNGMARLENVSGMKQLERRRLLRLIQEDPNLRKLRASSELLNAREDAQAAAEAEAVHTRQAKVAAHWDKVSDLDAAADDNNDKGDDDNPAKKASSKKGVSASDQPQVLVRISTLLEWEIDLREESKLVPLDLSERVQQKFGFCTNPKPKGAHDGDVEAALAAGAGGAVAATEATGMEEKPKGWFAEWNARRERVRKRKHAEAAKKAKDEARKKKAAEAAKTDTRTLDERLRQDGLDDAHAEEVLRAARFVLLRVACFGADLGPAAVLAYNKQFRDGLRARKALALEAHRAADPAGWQVSNPARVDAEESEQVAATEGGVEKLVVSRLFDVHRAALKDLFLTFADVPDQLREAWSMPTSAVASALKRRRSSTGSGLGDEWDASDGGGWTVDEDQRLRIAVAERGTQDWGRIAIVLMQQNNRAHARKKEQSNDQDTNNKDREGETAPPRERSPAMCERRWADFLKPDLLSHKRPEIGVHVDDAADDAEDASLLSQGEDGVEKLAEQRKHRAERQIADALAAAMLEFCTLPPDYEPKPKGWTKEFGDPPATPIEGEGGADEKSGKDADKDVANRAKEAKDRKAEEADVLSGDEFGTGEEPVKSIEELLAEDDDKPKSFAEAVAEECADSPLLAELEGAPKLIESLAQQGVRPLAGLFAEEILVGLVAQQR